MKDLGASTYVKSNRSSECTSNGIYSNLPLGGTEYHVHIKNLCDQKPNHIHRGPEAKPRFHQVK